MIRSLYSGVSGMKNHQVRMDSIGNNIANVNTTGYKSNRTNFQDIVYQTIRSGSGPTGAVGTTGSINPSQVGTGMTVVNIDTNLTQGALQNTGRTLDLAISGNGFFQVKDGAGNLHYTRNGVFYVDKNNTLVDANGNTLCGGNSVAGNPISIAAGNIGTINIGKDGTITATNTAGAALAVTNGPITLASFANPMGLKKVGQNYFDEVTTVSGAATAIASTSVEIDSGYLEMSNVDLTDEFTNMIVTQRGYQANARTITTSDQMLQELLDIKR